MRRVACADLCFFSCLTVVAVVVLVVAVLFKSHFPDVARKFICSSSNVADMVVPTLDNRGNIKTQTMPYLCLRLVFLQIRRQLVIKWANYCSLKIQRNFLIFRIKEDELMSWKMNERSWEREDYIMMYLDVHDFTCMCLHVHMVYLSTRIWRSLTIIYLSFHRN